MRKIVTSGFGWSGSSTLRQYLRNYPGMKVTYEIKNVRRVYSEWKDNSYKNIEKYRKQANESIEREAKRRWDNQKVAVFDNLVFAYHIRGIDLLEDVVCFPFFRDPRSNYAAVARKEECPKFDVYFGDVETFIKKYRQKRDWFERDLPKVKNPVHPIQFEDFMLKKEVKDDVVRKCGLDPGKITKIRYKCFPLEDNVYVHEKHPDKGEIRVIEEELGEFLYEF